MRTDFKTLLLRVDAWKMMLEFGVWAFLGRVRLLDAAVAMLCVLEHKPFYKGQQLRHDSREQNA